MKFLKQGLCLGLLAAGLVVAPSLQAQAGTPAAAPDKSLVDRIRAEADGAVTVSREPATGKVGFLRATDDLLPGLAADDATSAAAKADAYLAKYGAAFGAGPDQLVQDSVTKSGQGWTVTYTQRYQGLDVYGSMVKANLDADGNLTAVNGYAAPDLDLSVEPRRSADQASSVAVGTVKAMPPGDHADADTSGVKAAGTDLVVYRLGSTKGTTGQAVLAYVVEVTNDKNVRDFVFVDANTGKVVNRFSTINDALDRELYEASGTRQAPVLTKVWSEGDPLPGALNVDQQNEVVATGESYWFFKNVFGRDSWDGAGAKMITVNNDPRINCPNANWNGATTNYCSGVTADDVVAHEWGHAYTERTHGLIYQWQSGALNESYSDIWGETVDLINGRMDSDEGDITTKRPDGLCSSHTPALPRLVINSPASIAKICAAGAASFGPPVTEAGTTGNVVIALDATTAPGPSTTDACTPLTNGAAVAGKVAMADRGGCSFKTKTLNLQNAGAIGAVLGNTTDAPFGMADDATITTPITIPTVGIASSDRNRIASGLTGGGTVNVTMKDASTAAKSSSYRWLMGEDATAFGAAIRDMWVPTCLGDPGKVSDVEYVCSTDDAGGVHSNSGVPNHGYALLVDGGSYNGVTVTGLGLDKAAAIYWRAMTAYQTPTTDFGDHADALAASCSDLVGKPINKLTVTPNAAPVPATPVAAADCAQVAAMSQAVELRKEPTQCNFQPLFDPTTPSVCGPGFSENVVFKEDFEDGLAGWGTDQEVAFPGGFGKPWVTQASPAGHATTVAYGNADGRLGQCSGGAGDFSSRDSITSPIIEMPSVARAPRLSFEHSISSELQVDGGNVKVSLNGGPYQVVPAEAYVLNAPMTLLPAAAGNTNPMAGEDAFTGTDGGTNTTKWGTSQIDLEALGAGADDTVQFRFDIGRDGCGGVTGWYVDNITLTTCKLAAKVTALHVPEPSQFGKVSSVDVAVVRSGSVGAAPSGDVTLTDSKGALVGQATLANGKASIEVPAKFPVGKHTLVATYLGSDSMASATTTVVVTVVKGKGKLSSKTEMSVKPGSPDFKENFKAKVKVTSDGTVPTGKVRLFVDGKKIGKGLLNSAGKLVVRVRDNLKPGTHTLVARYVGTGTVQRSKDKVTVTIRK